MDHANAGYERVFGTDDLTVGVGFPLTDASESRPDHETELRLAGHAEELGFDALWARDVPLYWPRFGDAGQTFDPWTWLTAAAANTDEIALGTASVVLPLRHPLHVAKSAASVDRLSDGRLVLGVATGDRDPEYPAFDVEADDRGALFRESVDLLRTVWREGFPEAEGRWGRLDGDLDLVPKPTAETIPLLPTGNARQSVEWIADNGDGWLFYHLPEDTLESYLDEWRGAAGEKPYAMVVRTVLADDPTADPEPVHQGYRAGSEWFVEYFRTLDAMGVDHVVVSTPSEDPERELTALAESVFERL
ncbi:TIGR03571 family LLM class oxidoreductase [Halomicroarcula limicola]|uniref:TIGR03571 family LLM class oxidoreductase n=1 Tax=Haloarcula limicola TaxID=1429915 RepID=A0A8J7Y1X8_9EURY|nr:TIGR03571 family LLM class oxidoreductase [Halomicroarcula limicola]MBV0923220.1 TIGR03571 family LLM class oxidoreductase [Halomicroarcula limicola]